jgi:hypothetical protein
MSVPPADELAPVALLLLLIITVVTVTVTVVVVTTAVVPVGIVVGIVESWRGTGIYRFLMARLIIRLNILAILHGFLVVPRSPQIMSPSAIKFIPAPTMSFTVRRSRLLDASDHTLRLFRRRRLQLHARVPVSPGP